MHDLSFIIPHKDDPLINRLLQSLSSQTSNNFEVLIVDSSDDETSLETISKWKNHLDLRIISAKCGRGTARNIGAKISKADILVFVDADVVLPTHFADELAKMFENNHLLTAVGFPIYPARHSKIPARVYRFLRFVDEFSFRYGKPRIPTTCAAYRRSVFRSRFFLDIVGEDVLFSAGITAYGKAAFAKHIKVYEEPRRWDRSVEIPKSLWHYIPAFAATFLILLGVQNSIMPKQEIRS